jgi:hypothetical protein
MEIIEPARVEERPEVPYVGIRVVTPFRGMLGVSDKLFAELSAWVEQSGVETSGYGFLRLHVIDMSGAMDLEVGLVTPQPTDFTGRVRAGALLAGRYATLTYKNHALQANRALIEWARDNELVFDRRDVPEGDRFACRYEACLTDPKVEPRKTKRAFEVAIKLAD